MFLASNTRPSNHRSKNRLTWKHERKKKVIHISGRKGLEFKVLVNNEQSLLNRATTDSIGKVKARSRNGELEPRVEGT